MKHKFKVNDKIRVFQNPPISEDSNYYGEETDCYDKYVGEVGVIIEQNGHNADEEPCYITNIPCEEDGGYLNVIESMIELMP